MMPESRRSFLKHSAAAVAAASAAGCAPGESRDPDTGSAGVPREGPAGAAPVQLPGRPLRAVAEAVLPAETGEEGLARAVTGFERWSAGLEPVAELSHPYLVPETRYSGPDPRPGWAAQLRGLEKECGIRYGRALSRVDVPARRKLLAGPLAQAGPGLGTPAGANHIAVALMAHFFASPEATDLCYRRTIAKQQCRGLDGALAEPRVVGS